AAFAAGASAPVLPRRAIGDLDPRPPVPPAAASFSDVDCADSVPAPAAPELIADLPEDSWKCDWCDFVAAAPHGSDKLKTHVRLWHPEHAHISRQPSLPEFRVPEASDVVEWPCPCCDKALIRTEPRQCSTAMLMTRLKHRRLHHPKEPKSKFLVKTARSNVTRATRAVIAAATAKRLLKHRTGGYGRHSKVEFYRIPYMGTRGRQARSSRVVYVCLSCMQTSDTANRLKEQPCAKVGPSSSRVTFIARLRKCISDGAGQHSAELLDGARALLSRLAAGTPDAPRRCTSKRKQPEARRQHDILALAWPTVYRDAYTFRMRFVCTTCLANGAVRSNMIQRPCGPVIRGAARLKRQLDSAAASGDDTAARTARLALHALEHALPVLHPPPAPPV
ncbi:unnamed protein product, partial [Symbiodinium necroappetens]